ncbi:MAG: ABC transporter permease [Pseudomonadota bacterium]
MFEVEMRKTRSRTAFGMLELIYHATVREIRKSHRNPLIGLLLNMLQTVIFVLTFYLLFVFLGMRGSAIRGDFLLYIMSGIFLFMCHTKAMAAVFGSEGPASAMMHHAPMNTAISISAAALSSLYLQTLSLIVVLFVYHVVFTPIVIENMVGAYAMVLVAWISGVGVGMVFLALKPWMPDVASIGSSIYARANMIASGKMFVANSLPSSMLVLFDWNPLFHAIDQARGFIFLHYNPHFSSWTYPLYVTAVLITIGLMAEFYTRKHASLSWSAGR